MKYHTTKTFEETKSTSLNNSGNVTAVERNATTGMMETFEETEEERCRVAMWRCLSRFTLVDCQLSFRTNIKASCHALPYISLTDIFPIELWKVDFTVWSQRKAFQGGKHKRSESSCIKLIKDTKHHDVVVEFDAGMRRSQCSRLFTTAASATHGLV